MEFLLRHPRSVPAGTFVFVLSDFLVPPSSETWLRVLERRWDLIPVVLQDPVWERSFPPIDGYRVRLADAQGDVREVQLRRGEAAEQRELNEQRWTNLLETFAEAALEPVVVASHEESEILRAFLDWAETRQAGGVGAW